MVEGGGDAAGWSIFFLLVVILAMLGGIAFFMFRIARREKEHFDPTLSDDYQASRFRIPDFSSEISASSFTP